MARFPNNFGNSFGAQPIPYATPADEMTISQFFNAVYAWMAAGLALTGVVAFVVANRPDLLPFARTPGTFLLLFVVQIILVMAISGAVNRISPAVATALFLLYAALNGVTL